MNLLFVHSGADLYGASRSLLRLTSRLVEDQHTVMCILPYDGPLVDALRKKGVTVQLHTTLPILTRTGVQTAGGILKLFTNLLRSSVQVWWLIRARDIDLVHTNTAVILSSGIAAVLSGRPHIWHVRESFNEFGVFWRLYRGFIVLFATTIVCVSASIADQFIGKIRARRVRIVHNGFPVAEFSPVSQDRIDSFRAAFNLDGHLLVGVVGRIKLRRKGQEVLAHAVALLGDRFPNVRYLFVGSPFVGNEIHLAKLVTLVQELGIEDRVVFTGEVEDIGAVYSSLDISVLTSCQPEPFGGVVIESMAYGKPVIGTRIGGTVEQIDHGVTGLLVNPEDPEDLKRSLDRLLSDSTERERMGRNGRERFLELFEFEKFYERIRDVYREQLHQPQALSANNPI